MSYRGDREKLGDDAENNTTVVTADSNKQRTRLASLTTFSSTNSSTTASQHTVALTQPISSTMSAVV